MAIYINRNNQQSGPFEEGVVIAQLQNGELSPDDLAIRQGDSQWQPLRIMFPNVEKGTETQSQIPSAAPNHQPSGENFAVHKTVKTGGGCRRVLSTILLILGILLTIGGFGLAIFNRVMPDHILCREADQLQKEVEQLTKDRDSARGTPRDADVSRKLVEKTNSWHLKIQSCSDMESYYLWWFVAFLAAGGLGFIFALVGFLARRVSRAQ